MRKMVVSILASLFLFTTAYAGTANDKIGVIDYRMVQEKSQIMQHFQKRFSKMREEFKNEFSMVKANQKAIAAETAKLKNKEAKFSDEERAVIEAKIKKLRSQNSAEQQKMRAQMMQARKQLSLESKQLLETTISKVAKQEGVSVVLNASSVAYAQHKVDLTDKVIAAIKADQKSAQEAVKQ